MNKPSNKTKKIKHYPRIAQDVFVTEKILHKVRDEMKAHSLSLFHELKADINDAKADKYSIESKMDSSLSAMNSKMDFNFSFIRSDMESMNSTMETMKSDIQIIKSDVHRIALLVEEQNNRNKIVLDGMSHIFGRQDQLESDFAEFKK